MIRNTNKQQYRVPNVLDNDEPENLMPCNMNRSRMMHRMSRLELVPIQLLIDYDMPRGGIRHVLADFFVRHLMNTCLAIPRPSRRHDLRDMYFDIA
jgi:hypothetical protein